MYVEDDIERNECVLHPKGQRLLGIEHEEHAVANRGAIHEAALTAGGSNHTVEPTYTAGAFLLTVDLNQRATFRWVAPPGGELVTPATNANGAGVLNSVATALVVDLDLKFQEQ